MTQIFTRSEWGARYDRGRRPARLPAQGVFAHHAGIEGPGPDASFEEEVAFMQRLERTGEQRFGYGISYSFVVFNSGRIFEGHGVEREGVHTAGHNDTHRAICFADDYRNKALPETARRGAGWLLAHGYFHSWWGPGFFTGVHNDVSATACPGQVEGAVPAINAYAKHVVDAVVRMPSLVAQAPATTVPPWATAGWAWATGEGFLKDDRPDAAITRAELAVVLHRAFQQHPNGVIPGYAAHAYAELGQLAEQAGISWVNRPTPNVPLTEARYMALTQRFLRIVERMMGSQP